MKLIPVTPQEREVLLILHKKETKRLLVIFLILFPLFIFAAFAFFSNYAPLPALAAWQKIFLDSLLMNVLTTILLFFLVTLLGVAVVSVGHSLVHHISLFKKPLYYCTGTCISRNVFGLITSTPLNYTFQLQNGPNATFIRPPYTFGLGDAIMFIYNVPEYNFMLNERNQAPMYCRNVDFLSTANTLWKQQSSPSS